MLECFWLKLMENADASGIDNQKIILPNKNF